MIKYKQIRPRYMKVFGVYGYYRKGYFFAFNGETQEVEVEKYQIDFEGEKLYLEEGIDYVLQ